VFEAIRTISLFLCAKQIFLTTFLFSNVFELLAKCALSRDGQVDGVQGVGFEPSTQWRSHPQNLSFFLRVM